MAFVKNDEKRQIFLAAAAPGAQRPAHKAAFCREISPVSHRKHTGAQYDRAQEKRGRGPMGEREDMNKNIVRKLKLMLRPTRKKVIVAVAVVAVAGVGLYVNSRVRRAQQALAGAVQQATYRTVTLERASLSDSVTVTGTVESGDVANVTTQLTATVDEILVQVGDTVQEGDVICTLDSSDLEDQLAKLREQQSDTGESAQRSVEQAEKSLATAQENLTDAYNTYASAVSALETARAAWRPAYESIKAY